MRVLLPPKQDMGEIQWERVDVNYICGLGLQKIKKDTDGRVDCNIF